MGGWFRWNGVNRRLSPRRLHILHREHTAALAGGLAAAGIVLGVGLWVVPADDRQAVQLLSAMMPTLRFFGFAILSASATVLLLMLTLFSVSMGSRQRLRPEYYLRIKHLVAVDSIVLLVGIPFMLMLALTPAFRHTNLVPGWFVAEYVLLLAIVALLGGLLVAVMVMLYQALRNLIHAVGLDDDLELVEPP
jgi:hypothetical protein